MSSVCWTWVDCLVIDPVTGKPIPGLTDKKPIAGEHEPGQELLLDNRDYPNQVVAQICNRCGVVYVPEQEP